MALLHAQHHLLSNCNQVPIFSHLIVIHLKFPPTFLCLRNVPPCESGREAELSPTVLANTVSSYVPKPTLQVGCQHLTKSDAPAPASNVQEQGSWEGEEVPFCGGTWDSAIRSREEQQQHAEPYASRVHLGTRERHLTLQLGQPGPQSLSQILPTAGGSLYKPLSF